MSTRFDRLRAYLAGGARLPFVWGDCDCVSWPCGWVSRERGFDPMASVRGAYDSHLTCARFLRRQGGLIALAKREMASSGLTETEAPQCGDVGIISTSAGPMGAVRAGNLWALKAVDGLVLMPLPFLTAWSV